MNSRARNLLGALLLCALSICGFAAASASATGLTAVECEELGPGHNYKSNHCTTPKTVGEGNWETVVIPKNTPKEAEAIGTRTISATEHGLGNTANPVGIFHSTVNGIETTVTCGAARGTGGSFENIEEGGEMKIKGTGESGSATECHASPKTKPTKICTVQGVEPAAAVGEIKGNAASGITGPEHKIIVKPLKGTTLTKFKINASGGECFTTVALEVLVTGEGWGRANTETHSHATSDEASNAGSPLRANGAVASITATGTAFTKGNEEAIVGAETF